jgi:transcriptional regulator with XRE-family HTH domain
MCTGKTMKNTNETMAFQAAFRQKIQMLGYGSQCELSAKSGVSKSMINDILRGRSFGKLVTRSKLIKALDFPDYESFLNYGKQLILQEKISTTLTESGTLPMASAIPVEVPTLEVLLAENRALRIEVDKLRQDLSDFRSAFAEPTMDTSIALGEVSRPLVTP